MSVMVETPLGSLVIDLFTEECPQASRNFLRLCKAHYYDNVLFFKVEKDFIAQAGDRTGTGKGGTSFDGCVRPRDPRASFSAASVCATCSPIGCALRIPTIKCWGASIAGVAAGVGRCLSSCAAVVGAQQLLAACSPQAPVLLPPTLLRVSR